MSLLILSLRFPHLYTFVHVTVLPRYPLLFKELDSRPFPTLLSWALLQGLPLTPVGWEKPICHHFLLVISFVGELRSKQFQGNYLSLKMPAASTRRPVTKYIHTKRANTCWNLTGCQDWSPCGNTLKERYHTVLNLQIRKLTWGSIPRPESTRAFWIQSSDHSFLSLAINFNMKLEKDGKSGLHISPRTHSPLKCCKDRVPLLVSGTRCQAVVPQTTYLALLYPLHQLPQISSQLSSRTTCLSWGYEFKLSGYKHIPIMPSLGL